MGGFIAIKLDPIAYQSHLDMCNHSLIGRVVLSKGLVRFYDPYWEFWHPKIISDLGRGIGVPLRIDKAIVDGDFGNFALVLVDIDVSPPHLNSLMLEKDDSHSLFISLEYENLPYFCTTCSSNGHLPSNSRWNKSGDYSSSVSRKNLHKCEDSVPTTDMPKQVQDSVVAHSSVDPEPVEETSHISRPVGPSVHVTSAPPTVTMVTYSRKDSVKGRSSIRLFLDRRSI
ncbi:hypothetical protein Dsin_030137 [Dipteronia sinensis]|uniref:DUF4283 domain-containing protein n=1 Tax=Dipteronia sinensis TaxID=43782 RepID=A0AAE0DQN9_9ROSI|nr:hypothetical protein Dsin_030137 [Dipteronia sinensis]